MGVKIKDCPLCKARAKLFEYGDVTIFIEYMIECTNCGCNVKGLNKKELIKLWNRRVK